MQLYNFSTNTWDHLNIESHDESFDYSEYVGDDNVARNLYELYKLDGRTNVCAAIETLVVQLKG